MHVGIHYQLLLAKRISRFNPNADQVGNWDDIPEAGLKLHIRQIHDPRSRNDIEMVRNLILALYIKTQHGLINQLIGFGIRVVVVGPNETGPKKITETTRIFFPIAGLYSKPIPCPV